VDTAVSVATFDTAVASVATVDNATDTDDRIVPSL
jgi:hypothetical protein